MCKIVWANKKVVKIFVSRGRLNIRNTKCKITFIMEGYEILISLVWHLFSIFFLRFLLHSQTVYIEGSFTKWRQMYGFLINVARCYESNTQTFLFWNVEWKRAVQKASGNHFEFFLFIAFSVRNRRKASIGDSWLR